MTTNCSQVFPLCLSRKRIAFPNYLSKKKGSPRLSWTSGLPLVVVTSQRTQIVSSPVPQSHCGRRLRAVPGRQRKRPTYERQSWQHVFEVTTGCGDFTSLQFVFKPVCKPRTPTGRRPLREAPKGPPKWPGSSQAKNTSMLF